MPEHRRVTDFESFDKSPRQFPPVRKPGGTVELHGAGGAGFWDHPDLTSILKDHGIRQVDVVAENRLWSVLRARLVELDYRDHSLPDSMVVVLYEHEKFALVPKRKRICIEVMTVVRQAAPA
jgi:hypothetical protein